MLDSFVAYINGHFVSKQQAKISILDLGLTRGYGVFDFLRTYQGIPFYFEDHFQRFQHSAKLLDLKCPITLDEAKEIVKKLMKKNKQKEAAVKMILTGGEATHSLDVDTPPTLIIITFPLPFYPPQCFSQGIKMMSLTHVPFLSECKTLNYIPALLGIKKAKKQGAFEALFINQNQEVLEGSTSNFYVFKKNTLITPNKEIILGITRKVVLELAKKMFSIEERTLSYDELTEIDEAFISASNKEIMPVRQIDNILINKGQIGHNTSILMKLFHDYTRNCEWLNEEIRTKSS